MANLLERGIRHKIKGQRIPRTWAELTQWQRVLALSIERVK